MREKILTRREMLATLTAAGLALRVAQIKAAAPGFKIGVCDWQINKRSDPAALEVAKRIGLDGVMVDMGSLKNDLHLRRPEFRRAIRKR